MGRLDRRSIIDLLPILGYLFGSSFNAISVSMAAARGGAHPLSLLLLLPTYAGQFTAGVALGWMRHNDKGGIPTLFSMVIPVVLHVASNSLYGAAISLAGSALYQVCYASAPVFSIVYSKLLLGRSTSNGRIIAVVIIFGPLRVHIASSPMLLPPPPPLHL